MKKLVFILSILFATLLAKAQTPNLINFQGVAKGANGTLLLSKTIKVRLGIQSIYSSSPIYQETRTVTTNNQAAFSVQIGGPGALSTTGNFANINWSSNAYNIVVDIDIDNNNNFVSLGMQRISSVPFVKYADNASKLDNNAKINLSNLGSAGVVAGNIVVANNGTVSPTSVPALPTNSIALPYSGSVKTNDPRPLMMLGNTGTGRAVAINTNSGIGLKAMAKSGSAVNAGTNSASMSAVRISNLGTGSGLVATSGLPTSTALEVSSTNNSVPALISSGNIQYRGTTNNPPVKGAVLSSDEEGIAKWEPTQVACKQKGLWSTHTVNNGEIKLNLNVEEYDLGNNMSPTSEFVVPFTGTYMISGKALVSAYEEGILGLYPKLKFARLAVRIQNPVNGITYDTWLDSRNCQMDRDSYLSLSGELSVDLNKNAVVTFYVIAEGTGDYKPVVEDAAIAISIQNSWN